MYLRLVQAKVKPDATGSIREVYNNAVIPVLQETPGCVSACLMHNPYHPEEVVSLTIWDSVADAEAYVERGKFGMLIKQVQPFLEETTEWRTGLSREMKLEYSPVPQEPKISSYPVSLTLPTKQSVGGRPSSMYLRIVSVMLKPELKDEYHRLYINEIIPALQEAKGCLHAYLIMPSKGSNESLSVTIWESKAEADVYEAGGLFAELVAKVKHTFTDMVQWKMELDSQRQRTSAATEDLKVEGFSVVAMKSFR